LECKVVAYDPDGGEVSFRWEATGDAVLWPDTGDYSLLSNMTLYQTETVIIHAEDDNNGQPKTFRFSFSTGYAPVIRALYVAGNEVEEGDFAGTFHVDAPSTARVSTEGPPLGENLYYQWVATGDAEVDPVNKAHAQFSNQEMGKLEKVTVKVWYRDDGPFVSRSFYFETAYWEGDVMKLVAIPHPEDPEHWIRLIMEVSDMLYPSLGVNLYLNYDHNKLYAEDTRIWDEDDDDCHVHTNCPFGSDALNLLYPEMSPSSMTVAGFEISTEGGPVFYVDFLVKNGSGTFTDFTFANPDYCEFANEDGNTFRTAHN
jgi:hypothetical protein